MPQKIAILLIMQSQAKQSIVQPILTYSRYQIFRIGNYHIDIYIYSNDSDQFLEIHIQNTTIIPVGSIQMLYQMQQTGLFAQKKKSVIIAVFSPWGMH